MSSGPQKNSRRHQLTLDPSTVVPPAVPTVIWPGQEAVTAHAKKWPLCWSSLPLRVGGNHAP